MIPALEALIALQAIDTASDGARRRIADLPAMIAAIDAKIEAMTAAVDACRVRLEDARARHRSLERDLAGAEARLARFDEHKAAVKTNQEYTALLHEIDAAKRDKSTIEDQTLLLLEQLDAMIAELKDAEAAVAATRREADDARASIGSERMALEAELARLGTDRAAHAAHVDARTLSTYEQLLKGRRGVAVALMTGEICAACHVRLRPHIAQMVRRNDTIVQCESCQRILYFVHAAPPPASGNSAASSDRQTG